MAIRVRRGLYDDFDLNKMLPGEFAVAVEKETNKQIIWMCFYPGVTKRLGTYEDFKAQIEEATGEIKSEYLAEFEVILSEIKALGETTQNNTDSVMQINSDFINTYLPQIQKAVEDSAEAASAAEQKAKEAENYSLKSQSYAVGEGGVRENEEVDNAKYYYEQAKRISQGMSGALLPIGTVTFEELQNQTKQAGYMYNISNDFVTDETFNDGGGISYPGGTNVYYTADGYWDCLAGTITAEGIGALAADGDSKNNTVTFTSDDNTAPSAWSDVDLLGSGEKHSSIFNKISTMFKNIRWLYKKLGTVDISAIGDGTVTGAVKQLNSAKQDALGFTPIQQGGGANQNANKIYIGWTNESKLGLQVDVTNLGNIVLEKDVGTLSVNHANSATCDSSGNNIASKFAAIGTYIQLGSQTDVSIASDAWFADAAETAVQLDVGVWVIYVDMAWTKNAEGKRSLGIYNLATGVTMAIQTCQAPTGQCEQTSCLLVSVTEKQYFCPTYYQTSGSDIVVKYKNIRAVRIA